MALSSFAAIIPN